MLRSLVGSEMCIRDSPMAYLPSHPLDLNETNADISYIHTLCLVRRSLTWDVVYLEPEVLYWPKKIWRHSPSWAYWDVSPGFPDDKSLPGHSPMFPAHLFCVQQPTSTNLDTSFTPGLRLQVSSVVGVLFPRCWGSLGFVRSLKPHQKKKKKSNQITLVKTLSDILRLLLHRDACCVVPA